MANTPANHTDGAYTEREESSFVNVEAWTEEARRAISSLAVSSPPTMRGTSISLSIPLDDDQVIPKTLETSRDGGVALPRAVRDGFAQRVEPRRRDSLRRRDALLKGNEGSRRRQRWENDRLLGNPHAMPPLPADWEVRPTHPVHSVPYYLASLWDAKMAEEARQDTLRKRANDAKGEDNCTIGRVPKALKAKLKKSRGAKGLLQDLEHEVRKFVETWEEKEHKLAKYETFDGDSEDDEIVFVPNNALLHSRDNSFDFMDDHYREKLVFDGPDEDRAASFGRWLVHNLGLYYGLETWSVTVGNPPRREAYVGIRDVKLKQNRRASPSSMLPRPLWAMV